MDLLEQLRNQGWHLFPAGLERLSEESTGTIDAKQAIKLALDIDLREIGGGALASITARGNKADAIDANIVVQILKVRNISAPKANEESKVAPRLLKLTVTDGQTQYSALEGEHVPSVSLDTPPGTKIFLKNGPIKISQGLLILNANNVSVLGGRVSALVEKWELGRAMAKYAKGGRNHLSASGPPPWIAFGQKIQQNLPNDKNFKSLQAKEKDESKENAEFTALRNDAIAEATKLGTKKTFGGGAKQMVDANVQKIMDKGFSEDQAVHALKLTRNNVHRALSNLQRIEDRKQTQNDIKTGRTDPPQKLGRREMRGKRDTEAEGTSKPSTKVSLFDFLEDILPESDTSNKKSSSKDSTPFSAKENNQTTDPYSNKSNSSNSYYNTYPNNRSSSGNPSNQYQLHSSSQYNNPAKSYNQQRFENNISSSFANRNSHSGPNSRNYNPNLQHEQAHQPSNNSQQGYKQPTDYNSGRYRGQPNAQYNHPNDAYPRGRQDSKYNQSSYNPHQNQQSQYRSDNYNNNTTACVQGNKYQSSLNNSGKPQQSAANYGYGHLDSKDSQNYSNQSDSRKHVGATTNHYQQPQQSQHPSQFYQPGEHKQTQGYGTNNNSTGNHLNLHYNSAGHHNEQSNHNNANAYNSSSAVGNIKHQKGSRYAKDDIQNLSAPSTNAQGRKSSSTKIHNPSQQVTQPGVGSQPAVLSNNKTTAVTTASATNNNNNNKISQLTDATANMQISNNKPFINNSAHAHNATKPSQPHISGHAPATPPVSATTPVVPKNFIQLPNGFNYNPYQIVGFQNKQTNEFALNVLKSQQIDALQSAQIAAAQSGGPPSIPGVTIPPTAAVVPTVLSAVTAGHAGPTIHPSIPAGVIPNWKVGDRCFAKYWEDGGFYNAEITGISENTFVVCFMEYGNYEEVLKTDCIPLTGPGGAASVQSPHGPPPSMGFHPTSHLPPGPNLMPPPHSGVYPGQAADSQSGQHFNHGYKPPQSNQYQHHLHPPHHQSSSQHRPSKFREQRPMYVPPAQRK
ncbi:tudor domain-containing protein 3 isoform X2 [Malaya genurostris]|uniref:tudor domain-containing protein 3 isoform X2 n=1 Tax=Malaya genurostris TaxID=325434 RepID=UPI0026F38CDD|nr:tudor domain-containing protein 3 isoform X2 [Malaya genurostris]